MNSHPIKDHDEKDSLTSENECNEEAEIYFKIGEIRTEESKPTGLVNRQGKVIGLFFSFSHHIGTMENDLSFFLKSAKFPGILNDQPLRPFVNSKGCIGILGLIKNEISDNADTLKIVVINGDANLATRRVPGEKSLRVGVNEINQEVWEELFKIVQKFKNINFVLGLFSSNTEVHALVKAQYSAFYVENIGPSEQDKHLTVITGDLLKCVVASVKALNQIIKREGQTIIMKEKTTLSRKLNPMQKKILPAEGMLKLPTFEDLNTLDFAQEATQNKAIKSSISISKEEHFMPEQGLINDSLNDKGNIAVEFSLPTSNNNEEGAVVLTVDHKNKQDRDENGNIHAETVGECSNIESLARFFSLPSTLTSEDNPANLSNKETLIHKSMSLFK